jgi:Asp/Glu/hydantoin racemase
MSFLTSRTFAVARPSAFAPAARAFTTTALRQKTATQTVKDTFKTVDRAVSEKIVDGIELGGSSFPSLHNRIILNANPNSTEAATQKVKETAGISTDEAKGKASEMAGAAQGKASELSGEAKGKASEMTGKAKGKAAEAKGKM